MTARTDEPDLDPLIHAPVRLRIMVTLSQLDWHDSLSFPRLQKLLDLTAGNLITHLRKLEDGEYVEVSKTGDGSTIALTAGGRAALQAYTSTLRKLLGSVGE
jgi:DNA-binding MarR family transcriptional regulator